MKDNTLNLELEQYNLQENKALVVANMYQPMLQALADIEAEYNEIVSRELINATTIEDAADLRKRIVKMRTGADKVRKHGKQSILLEGRALDGAYNTFKFATSTKEEVLMGLEKHFENIENERIEALEETRILLLEKFNVERDTVISLQLGIMAEDVWSSYLLGVKTNYEGLIQAEKDAEDRRKKEDAIKVLHEARKNELLDVWSYLTEHDKALNFGSVTEESFEHILNEAQNDERIATEEAEKLVEVNKALQEDAKKKEKEVAEKQFKDAQKAAKEKAELQAIADKAQKDKGDAEAKAQLIIDQQAYEDEEKERAEQELLAKGDAGLVEKLVEGLVEVKGNYAFESDKNKKMFKDVCLLLDKVIAHIEIKSE